MLCKRERNPEGYTCDIVADTPKLERYQTLLDMNELYTIGQRKGVIRAKKIALKEKEM